MWNQSFLLLMALSLVSCAPDSAIRPYKYSYIKITGADTATINVHNFDVLKNSPDQDRVLPYTIAVPIDNYHLMIFSIQSFIVIEIKDLKNKITIPPMNYCEIIYKNNALSLTIHDWNYE